VGYSRVLRRLPGRSIAGHAVKGTQIVRSARPSCSGTGIRSTDMVPIVEQRSNNRLKLAAGAGGLGGGKSSNARRS